MSAAPVQTIILVRTTAIRAALTRFELLAHRKQHGRLPNRLLELVSTMEDRNLVDPWSNRLFDYYPEFLLSTGNSNSAVLPIGGAQAALKGHFSCPGSDFTSGLPKRFHLERHFELDQYDVQNRVLFPIPQESAPPAQQP